MFESISRLFGILKPLRPISGWFIRLPFAATMLFHGYSKFSHGIENFAGNMSDFGAMALPVAVLVASAEILAGIGAIVGGLNKGDMGDAATRLAGLAAFPVLLGAIGLVHWGRWSFTPAEAFPIGGMEFQVLLLGVAVYLMLKGSDA